MQSNNNLLEDLLRPNQKRSNQEDNTGPDLKKARNINVEEPSSPPAGSSNDLSLAKRANMVNQPNQTIHIDLCNDRSIHIQMNQPVHIQQIYVQNQKHPTTMLEHSAPPPAGSSEIQPNRSIYIDLCNDHHTVHIQESKIPRFEMQPPTSTESSPVPASSNKVVIQPNQSIYIDLCNDHHPVHIRKSELPHFENQVQPTTSKHSSSLPASCSNNLFLESNNHLVNQPNQLIPTQMKEPVHIRKPEIPHFELEHIQNQVQPTTSKHSSSLPASSSNNVFLERNNHLVNQPNQLIHTQMNQPVHIRKPEIPHFELEHIQNQVQPSTSKHSSSQPASSSNNVFLESNNHLVSQPNQLIHTQIKQPVHIQEPKIPQVKVENVQNNMQTTSKHNYCEEIYRKLRAMFPNIEREYIKTFCPANWIPGVNQEVQFNSIVDTIFLNEHSWVIAETPNLSLHDVQNDDLVVVPNVDDTYEHLTVIFPNADPHYLRSAAEKFTNENDMTTFIELKLQNNDYPTREQYLAKMKVTEEQQRYTKDFNVEQFLTLFPDPHKHFEDNERKCKYNLIAVEFLKNIFNKVRVNTINKIYRQCKYNISITAKNLRNSTDFISCSRRVREIPTEDIQLLQEMAFVRHNEKILQHMQIVKQREEDEFNLLKTLGGLYTCQCCFDEECMPSKCSTCDNGHIFCNSCIINGTDSKLGDGETHVPCFLDCGSEFSIATFQKILPPTKLCIFLKKRQAAEVAAAGLEGLVFCPFCDFASIPPEGDKVFKCFNPECMKESCIQCKEPNHVPYSCGDKRSEKARQYIEEKMTEALTRTCYKCKKTFFKEEGCNKMTCTCGAHMCYICSQPVDHVEGYKHFRGQGSNEVGKCPLWTDNQVLNVETVRKVEEEARREILRQDPTMNINTTVLAPTVQPSRPGPHVGISDARNLANILAARVLSNNRFELK